MSKKVYKIVKKIKIVKKKNKYYNNNIEIKKVSVRMEDKKKIKKKVKFKKKKVIIPIILLFIVLGIGGYFAYQAYVDDTVKSIKKAYNEYVVTNKKAKLYNSNKKEIGTISKGYELQLDKVKKYTIKNRHLKIKDTNYYISYKDITKTEKKEEKVIESYYLPLNKSIKTKSSISLYENNKEIITLKSGVEAPLERIDKDNYYVRLLNKTLSTKKSKDIKEINNKEKTNEKKAEYISTIYYDKIKDDCGGDDTCLSPLSVTAHINKLKKEGYYFITKEDFINYLNDYVNLKEKAIFIATGEENDLVKNLNTTLNVNISKVQDTDGIKLTVTNKKTTKSDAKDKVNCYQAKRYTLIDRYSEMAAGNDVVDNGRENSTNQNIAVLNYHFFYDNSIPGERAACNESICLEKQKLKEQLQWLKDNNYKTLTIHEFADWMDGIIEIPDKSVLLTIDDGAHGTGAHNGNVLIPLLEEYKEHATLFLIAGWWDIGNYSSEYLDIQSHSFNLHFEQSCGGGRGMVACSDYNTVRDDLQKSIDVIKDKTTFCFPFYSTSDNSLRAVKDLGFRYSFVGGSVKANRNNNHYLIPRYPIMEDISLNEFINMVS